jgi:virginiamycin B lyase
VNAIRLAALLLGLTAVSTAQSGTFIQLSLYGVPSTGGTPIGIALGPDGAMWFAEYAAGGSGGEIGRITTAGTITQYPITTSGGAVGIGSRNNHGQTWNAVPR